MILILMYVILLSILNKNQRFHGKECKKNILFFISNESKKCHGK